MSDVHYYLSLIPQGLIASMLPPQQFGSYYALGKKIHARDEAIFFDVDPGALPPDEFPLQLAAERCVPKADGSPKKSLYLAIYRVLSRIPVAALGRLYLVTRDGQTLALDRADYLPQADRGLHLYQEFCPIDPLVASRLPPREFCRTITNPAEPVNVPRIVFSELSLGGLANDPLHGEVHDLPYPNVQNLRDILAELRAKDHKHSKLFLRQSSDGVHFRTLRGGFYVGDQTDFAFYAMPTHEALESDHRSWWRAAQGV